MHFYKVSVYHVCGGGSGWKLCLGKPKSEILVQNKNPSCQGARGN